MCQHEDVWCCDCCGDIVCFDCGERWVKADREEIPESLLKDLDKAMSETELIDRGSFEEYIDEC